MSQTGVGYLVAMGWQERALCRRADPSLFFPAQGGSDRAGRDVCARCPVREECLSVALANDERFGIWGGLNGAERRAERRRRRASAS